MKDGVALIHDAKGQSEYYERFFKPSTTTVYKQISELEQGESPN
jgi:hypothetical protein